MGSMKRIHPVFRFFKRLLCSCAVLLACSVLVGSDTPSLLEKIQASGKLYVLSRNGPTTYYEGPYGFTGFEYTLAQAFAKELGVELVIRDEDNLAILLDALGGPKAHIGASGLTVTHKRQRELLFSRPYLEITQRVIYNRDKPQPESLADLVGQDFLVIANSAHSERLRELRSEFPGLRWRERNDLEMIDLVQMVHNGELDYAIVDSNAFAINRNVYPNVQAAFDLSEPQQLAWAFPRFADTSLFDAAEAFFARIESSGWLAEVTDYYYGDADMFNQGGAMLFAERIESRLPAWEGYLKTAGEEQNIDWRLLAAMSYQESHWNSRARSHTGVRGLMMLTQVTAKELGIANRIDPEQSIKGGARYFKKIYERIPDRIQGADRTWMALAAYNVGTGHLEDARILTEAHGDDPDKWSDVQRYLPLLAERKYYQHTKHGYARGWEPVAYVQRIRQFYNILRWQDERRQKELIADQVEYRFEPVETISANTLFPRAL
ncbi:membrane-bound lytic murein transglycosylase MltF [Gilvimarinus sp. F26214L]|uniref:membrane-bound lytic murein transglycosylase MltF n=1 Tax=Gilvimarinus sp. DZF01 TaxID=3461371 RepID=UPI004046718D